MKSKQIGFETFAETIEVYRVPDVTGYLETGREDLLDKVEPWRATYRLKLDLVSGGVEWEILATVNARLLQWTQDERGERTAIFGAKNRWGRSFTFRLRERDFANSRAISRALCARGGAGTLVVLGKARAFLRAVLQFSEEGEPMPHDAGELAALDEADERDPFADDF